MRQKGIFFCLFVTEETVVYIIERYGALLHSSMSTTDNTIQGNFNPLQDTPGP